MCHRIDNESCKIGVSDERSGRVENEDDTVLARPLCLDEIAECVELKIGGKDAGYLAPQRRAYRNHRRADAKRQIRRRDNDRSAFIASRYQDRSRASYPNFQRSSCPTSLPCRSSKIRRMGSSPSDVGRTRLIAISAPGVARNLSRCSSLSSPMPPHLQPSAIFETGVDTIHLRQFMQCGFEQRDRAAGLRPFIGVGHAGTGCQHVYQRGYIGYFSLKTFERLRTGGVHVGRRGFLRCPR